MQSVPSISKAIISHWCGVVLFNRQGLAMKDDTKTQRYRVLAWLQQKPLSTLQAREQLFIMSIAARIFELKQCGHRIITQKIDSGTKKIAQYVLLAGDRA